MLVEEGLSRVAYVYPPNTCHLEAYEEAQDMAKKRELAIWSIENYATDRGFKDDGSSSEGQGINTETTNADKNEFYKNCTELRKVHPNGVPKGHPAYQSKMDRDQDEFTCER